MELNSKDVYKILKKKGLNFLYHANTVRTSCTFLMHGSLLSRGMVERHDLLQTEQSSDQIDKKYGIWFDVFTDSVDIHERSSSYNKYGPVLFVIDLEILNQKDNNYIWLSKLNPTKWSEVNYSDRWFQSLDDINDNFQIGTFNQMILFRQSGGELQLNNYLSEIILDDPNRALGRIISDICSYSRGALRSAYNHGNLKDVNFKKRICKSYCSCQNQYKRISISEIKRLFFP